MMMLLPLLFLPALLLSAAAVPVASAGGPADLGVVGSSGGGDAGSAAVAVRGAEELWALIEQVIPPDEARKVMVSRQAGRQGARPVGR